VVTTGERKPWHAIFRLLERDERVFAVLLAVAMVAGLATLGLVPLRPRQQIDLNSLVLWFTLYKIGIFALVTVYPTRTRAIFLGALGIDLLLIFDRGKARVGVRKHEGKFVGYRVGVDGHRNCAQHLRGHHRPIKPRPVAADDGNGLPASDAKIVQADGIGTHDVEHFVPRPGLPDAEILVPHGRASPIKLGIPDQQLGKRIRASGSIRRHSPVLPCGHARPSVAKTPRRLFLTILLSRYENTTRRRSSIR
jgi:hypothetical protein